MTAPTRAVVLLSGGMDSATCLAIDYGQRHRAELNAATRVSRQLGAAAHRVVAIGLGGFGGSALTDPAVAVPEAPSAGIPVTYVPARNTIFLSFALAWAEVVAAETIFIGVNAVDYSGYPDCRPAFIHAFEQMANLATKAGVEGRTKLSIRTPLLELTKAGIIHLGRSAGVDFALTHSCYDPAPDGRPCGQCDSCLLRAKGFAEAGVADPLLA